MSGKISSSPEERSTTGIASEGPPYSRTGEGDLCGDASSGDTDSGTESDGNSGGVEAPPDEEENESLIEERERLIPLLSSIVVRRRRREENPKRKVKECEMAINARRKEYL
jgi:hypothetical protein